eukprot:snap_masked-scaffold_6-processed-gene-2.36-mRNA-1 protein AED:1.00 eAED:1.00 QI:0/0/0/0/1/1/2/0/76
MSSNLYVNVEFLRTTGLERIFVPTQNIYIYPWAESTVFQNHDFLNSSCALIHWDLSEIGSTDDNIMVLISSHKLNF